MPRLSVNQYKTVVRNFERILSPTKYAQISVLGFQRKERIIALVRKVMKFLAQCFSGLYILKIRTSWLDSLSSICRWLHEASLVALKSNLYCISNVKISTKRIFLGVKSFVQTKLMQTISPFSYEKNSNA